MNKQQLIIGIVAIGVVGIVAVAYPTFEGFMKNEKPSFDKAMEILPKKDAVEVYFDDKMSIFKKEQKDDLAGYKASLAREEKLIRATLKAEDKYVDGTEAHVAMMEARNEEITKILGQRSSLSAFGLMNDYDELAGKMGINQLSTSTSR